MGTDAGGGALDRRDHGDLAVEDRVDGGDRAAEHHPPALADHPFRSVGRAVGLGRGRAAAQVGTGTEEPAGGADDDTADGEVFVGSRQPRADLDALIAGQRVAGLGPVERDGGDAVVDVEADAVVVLCR